MTVETESEALAPEQDALASEAEDNGAASAPQDGDEGEEGLEDGQPKPKGGFQRRIAELTRDRHETARDRDYWRDLAMRSSGGQGQPGAAPASTSPNPLDPTSYEGGEFDPGYIAAIAEDRAFKRMQGDSEFRAKQARAQDLQSKLTDANEGARRFLTDPNLPISKAMADVVFASEHGVKLADHLGANPSEAARIRALPDHLQTYELAKLETRLAATPARLPGAPPPAPQVGARGAARDGPRDEQTTEEWLAARNKQVLARR